MEMCTLQDKQRGKKSQLHSPLPTEQAMLKLVALVHMSTPSWRAACFVDCSLLSRAGRLSVADHGTFMYVCVVDSSHLLLLYRHLHQSN